ncbi:hypothetical protein [Kitasatospora camelliae]|uniref:Uncharacterized protein n=1 Tax=Kitasatospora camelliae TaxID=3156397 RepID=A0AAU8K684_9ACTN
MTTYRVQFGKLGDDFPVPTLTATAANRDDLCRQIQNHARPHMLPVLTELGRPELADQSFFHLTPDLTGGQFLALSLAHGTGARFLPARIEALA